MRFSNIAIELAMRELVYHLCELGWLYRKVASYLSKYRDNLAYGIVSAAHPTYMNIDPGLFFPRLAKASVMF